MGVYFGFRWFNQYWLQIPYSVYCKCYLKRSSLVVAECKNAWLPYYSADTTKQLPSSNMYLLILDTHIYDDEFQKIYSSTCVVCERRSFLSFCFLHYQINHYIVWYIMPLINKYLYVNYSDISLKPSNKTNCRDGKNVE